MIKICKITYERTVQCGNYFALELDQITGRDNLRQSSETQEQQHSKDQSNEKQGYDSKKIDWIKPVSWEYS